MSRVTNLGGPPADGAAANSSSSSNALSDVSMDEFLKLIITEMQNQDPLNPLENDQLLSQISQIREISSTDQLSDTLSTISTGQSLATASSMIGQEISALSDDAEEVQGVVDRVTIEPENDLGQRPVRLHVGEQEVSLQNVRTIYPSGSVPVQ